MSELERLEKNVVETKAAYAVYDTISDYSVSAYTSYAQARKELKDYRNYKKAQLIQQLAEIVIRHDIETT